MRGAIKLHTRSERGILLAWNHVFVWIFMSIDQLFSNQILKKSWYGLIKCDQILVSKFHEFLTCSNFPATKSYLRFGLNMTRCISCISHNYWFLYQWFKLNVDNFTVENWTNSFKVGTSFSHFASLYVRIWRFFLFY